MYSGKNNVAKMLHSKMELISPGFASKDMSNRFDNYVKKIEQLFNDLLTPLALNVSNESRVKSLTEALPRLIFLFSATHILPKAPIDDLNNFLQQMTDDFDKAKATLEEIINE